MASTMAIDKVGQPLTPHTFIPRWTDTTPNTTSPSITKIVILTPWIWSDFEIIKPRINVSEFLIIFSNKRLIINEIYEFIDLTLVQQEHQHHQPQHLDVMRPLNLVKSYQNFNLLHYPISMKSFQLNSIYGHFPNTKTYLPISINSEAERPQPVSGTLFSKQLFYFMAIISIFVIILL